MFKLQFEGIPHFSGKFRGMAADQKFRFGNQACSISNSGVSQLWSMMFTSGGNLQGFGPKYPDHIMNSVIQCATTRLFTALYVKHDRFGSIQQFAESKLTLGATKATCCRGGKLSQTFPASKISFCAKKWLVTSSMVFIPKTYTVYIRYKL